MEHCETSSQLEVKCCRISEPRRKSSRKHSTGLLALAGQSPDSVLKPSLPPRWPVEAQDHFTRHSRFLEEKCLIEAPKASKSSPGSPQKLLLSPRLRKYVKECSVRLCPNLHLEPVPLALSQPHVLWPSAELQEGWPWPQDL